MAIYHLSVRIVSRKTMVSPRRPAAYRAREYLYDGRMRKRFDYTREEGVGYTKSWPASGAAD